MKRLTVSFLVVAFTILSAKTFRASPHVAGHSMEARQNATMMLVESLFRWCHAEPGRRGSARQLSELLSDSKYEEVYKLTFPQGDRSNASLSGLVQLLGQCCPIDEINNAMLGLARLPETEVGGEFDRLRRQFAGRREFTAYQVPIEVSSRFEDNTLAELGFRVG